MKHLIGTATVAFVLGFAPAWAAAQDVTYDFDRAKNFAHVQTFALKEGRRSDNPLVDQRMAAAIVSMLTARGLRQVDHDPDVFVVPGRTTEMRKQVTAYNTGYWPYGSWYWPYYGSWAGGWGAGYWDAGWGWGTTTFEERNLQYDTLTIEMIDAKTGDLIWRGRGVKRVHSHWKPDEIDKKVQKTVSKIMSNYPPSSNSSFKAAP
jgi:hypothetical protein